MRSSAGIAFLAFAVPLLRRCVAAPFCLRRFQDDCRGNLVEVTELPRLVGPFDETSVTTSAFVDWDLDDDLDLVTGNADGKLRYFERLNASSMEERTGAGNNPFHEIDVGTYAVPAFVDWDGDGDLDLVCGGDSGPVAGEMGLLHYFENVGVGTLVERIGAGQNPFHEAAVSFNESTMPVPAFVDWDQDGDMDLVLGTRGGFLLYFENVGAGTLVERIGAGQNPFHKTTVVYFAFPAFVDWDQDGDMDLVIGDYYGILHYFERLAEDHLQEQSGAGSDPFDGILTANYAAPAFVDLKQDGGLDIVVGDDLGVRHFERAATRTLIEANGAKYNPFHGIAVSRYAAPAVKDWDQDGDLDLVVGDEDGIVHYFENIAVGTLVERTGAGQNPFHEITAPWIITPVLVDWDQDGDLDLAAASWGEVRYFENVAVGAWVEHTGEGQNPFHVVGLATWHMLNPAFVDWDQDGDLDLVCGGFGELHYFENVDGDTLVHRAGEGQNPFHNVTSNDLFDDFFPAFMDWDQDGDADLVVGTFDGSLRYFENAAEGTLVEVIGEGMNPFHGIDVGSRPTPAFVDWDQDGDLDVVIGNFDGNLYYAELGGCTQPFACAENGVCRMWGACDCNQGYRYPSCATCDPGFFTADVSSNRRQCLACPQDSTSRTCSARGTCFDDANIGVSASSATASMLAIGNGTCVCSEPSFSGLSCESGLCPGGSEERGSADGSPIFCAECTPGLYSHPGNGVTSCEVCPAGRMSLEGSSACDVCPLGSRPSEGQGGCSACPGGEFASHGADACTTCPSGRFSLPGSGACDACPAGSYPDAEQQGCDTCAGGQFAVPGEAGCERCPSGRFALTGSGACDECPPGLFSAEGSAECELDREYWFVFWAIAFMQFVGWYPGFFLVRRRISVVDVRSAEAGLLITLQRPHLVPVGREVDVTVAGTGHPLMDTGSGWRRGRALDSMRMQLANVTGVESSMGRLSLRCPQELFRTIVAGVWCPAVHACVAVALATALSVFFAIFFLPDRVKGVGWGLLAAHPLGICGAVVLAVFLRRLRASTSTRLDARLDAYRKELLAANPHPKRTERGPQRAVAAGGMQRLVDFFEDFVGDRNAYYLNANITTQLTKPFKLSMAEVMGPQLVSFFVSHFWGTPFRDFVQAVRKHAQYAVGQGLVPEYATWQEIPYWVCFLSNNQWNIAEELGQGKWNLSSFFLALHHKSCKATCMVLDRHALPLTRSWCLFEVLQTFNRQHSDKHDNVFNGLLLCTSEGLIGRDDNFDTAIALGRRLSTLSVQHATATDPQDQQMIIELVAEEEEQSGTTMNAFIRRNMTETLQMAKGRFNDEAVMLEQVLNAEGGEADKCEDSIAGGCQTLQLSTNVGLESAPVDQRSSDGESQTWVAVTI